VTTTSADAESTLASLELTMPGLKQRGRVFASFRALKAFDIAALTDLFSSRFVEEDDVERLRLLKSALTPHTVTFETYRGEMAPYELHAYVRASEVSEAPIFATVLAPMSVVEHLASMPPHIVLETATLQAITEEPTTASIVAALETWIRRIWPEQRVPTIVLSPWPGPTESRDASVEILRLFPAPTEVSGSDFSEIEGNVDFAPAPNLVAPEFRLTEEAA
jgi:hypothetical protein